MTQLYKHKKGGLYLLLHIAKHSETQEELVVYQSIATGEVWVRPKEMFFDSENGVPRFKETTPEEAFNLKSGLPRADYHPNTP